MRFRWFILFLVPIFLLEQSVLVADPPISKHKFFIHTYPTTILFGDISLGIEHQFKEKWSHEFSLNLKTFETKNFYDKGYRFDYFIKYNILIYKKFQLALDAAVMQRDVHFENKNIPYYPMSDLRSETETTPFMILREDRQLRTQGLGGGFTANLQVYRKFFIGTDIILYRFRNQIRRSEHEMIYGSADIRQLYGKTFPSYNISKWRSLGMLLRMKISLLL